jgi:hypothetical protein
VSRVPVKFKDSIVTVPVNVGLDVSALDATAVEIELNSVLKSTPLIVLAGSPEGKLSLEAKSVVGV